MVPPEICSLALGAKCWLSGASIMLAGINAMAAIEKASNAVVMITRGVIGHPPK
jgi:hypothetical protein